MDGNYPKHWTPTAGLFADGLAIADKLTVEAELLELDY